MNSPTALLSLIENIHLGESVVGESKFGEISIAAGIYTQVSSPLQPRIVGICARRDEIVTSNFPPGLSTDETRQPLLRNVEAPGVLNAAAVPCEALAHEKVEIDSVKAQFSHPRDWAKEGFMLKVKDAIAIAYVSAPYVVEQAEACFVGWRWFVQVIRSKGRASRLPHGSFSALAHLAE